MEWKVRKFVKTNPQPWKNDKRKSWRLPLEEGDTSQVHDDGLEDRFGEEAVSVSGKIKAILEPDQAKIADIKILIDLMETEGKK